MSDEQTTIKVPSVECMKEAIWAAVKTKTNFIRSSYLHDADSKPTEGETDYKKVYGPWTDGIMFTKNFSNNQEASTTDTQIVLTKVCVDTIPEIVVSEGRITGGIDQNYLNSIEFEPSEKQTTLTLDGKFVGESEDVTVNAQNVQVFEASVLGNYLKSLQEKITSGSEDTRVNQIIKDLYAVEDGTTVPETPGDKSALKLGGIVYGTGENASPTNPEENTIIYDLYGPDGVGSTGGIKETVESLSETVDNMTGDLYGSNGTAKAPEELSIKDIVQKNTIENGIMTEMTDYIFCNDELPSTTEFQSSYFTVDKIGYQVKYVVSTTTPTPGMGYDGTVSGYNVTESEYIDMKYDPDGEVYPALVKIVVSYLDTDGKTAKKVYEVVNH